jgi:hypothetical protein
MGYDSGDESLKIPLFFVYGSPPSAYNVKNPANPFIMGSGDDNSYCGFMGWPCKTIEYARSRNPTTNNPRKIGIITDYLISEPLSIGESGMKI